MARGGADAAWLAKDALLAVEMKALLTAALREGAAGTLAGGPWLHWHALGYRVELEAEEGVEGVQDPFQWFPGLSPPAAKQSPFSRGGGDHVSTGTGNTRFSTTAPHPTGVYPKPGQGDTSVFRPPGRARLTCPGGQRRPLRRSTSLIFNALAVPAGRTGALRRSTPLTRGSQNVANNTPPPVAAPWADRNRSRGGSQCGIRLVLPKKVRMGVHSAWTTPPTGHRPPGDAVPGGSAP